MDTHQRRSLLGFATLKDAPLISSVATGARQDTLRGDRTGLAAVCRLPSCRLIYL
jgi:hypothetical protein